MKCSGGFGALAGNAALPSATRPTDVPRVDVGQVDVWHVDVRDVYHVWHVDVRDVKSMVPGTPGMFSSSRGARKTHVHDVPRHRS